MEYKINGINYTDREIEIISCMCNGCSSKLIANILSISPYTVDSHIKNIKGKMNCFSRGAIIRFIETSEKYPYIHAKYAELRQLSLNCEQISEQNDFHDLEKENKSNYKILGFKKYIFLICLIFVAVWRSKVYIDRQSLSYEIQLPNKHILLPRDDIIKEIEKTFKSKEELKFVVLVGEAGIGKTTIARNYIKDHNFSIKAGIDAESEFKIIESFEDLVFLLSKNEKQLKSLKFIKSVSNPEEKRRKLKLILSELLKGYKNWCIIYDNAEDLELLRKWLPLDSSLFNRGNVIITTKNRSVENLIFPYQLNTINVSYLTEYESEKLFYSITNKKNKNDNNKDSIRLLLDRIPATPLDISSVAYFIKINKIDLRRYLELIRKKGKVRMGDIIKNELGGYKETRETIIATTFNKIISETDSNLELLMMLCLLDSENINKKYFKLIASEGKVESFIFQLKKYSILKELGDHFSIHRVTQEMGLLYLLTKFSREQNKKGLTKIIESLADHNQIEWKWSKSKTKMAKAESRMLIPHLESILKKLNVYKDLENYDQYRMKILMALYFAYNGECPYKESYERGRKLIELNSKNKIITGKDLALLLLQHVYVSIYCGETFDIVENAKNCLKICETDKNTDHFKIGAMLYLGRYYFDFDPNYEKANRLLDECFKLKEKISKEDWDIVMCVFANQIYRGYEAYYINDREKIVSAINYLRQALKDKGFVKIYRKEEIKEIPLDKTVFLMYAIEMMINISRGHNAIGEFEKALENELDIKYIYDLLDKQGIRFYSQEFQFNVIYGETLLKLGKIQDALNMLNKALINTSNISSKIDLFQAYVSRAEINMKLGKFEETIKDCNEAMNIEGLYSNYYLLGKCKCVYLKMFANYKQKDFDKCRNGLKEFFNDAKKLMKNLITIKKIFDLNLENYDNQEISNMEESMNKARSILNKLIKPKVFLL